jgi:hypothetical protein
MWEKEGRAGAWDSGGQEVGWGGQGRFVIKDGRGSR